jgi:O-Antigen ligase
VSDLTTDYGSQSLTLNMVAERLTSADSVIATSSNPRRGRRAFKEMSVAVSHFDEPADLKRPVRASGHGDSFRNGWTLVLIAIIWAWICLPKIVQTLLSPKYKYSVGEDAAPYSSTASLVDFGLYIGVIAVAALIIVLFATHLNKSSVWALILLLLPWAYITIRDFYVPISLSREGIVYPLVVLALWLLHPQLKRLSTLGYLIGFTALISVLIALVAPAQAILRASSGEVIQADKQILPGGLLVGIFTQPNNLGQFLAVGLPTILLIRKLWHRIPLLLITIYAIAWSASRGAMIAVGVGIVTYLVVLACRPAARRLIGPLAVFANLAVVCVVPFTTTDPSAFSNRGLIWTFSLNAWEQAPWNGLGINWYNVIGATSERLAGSVFHGHNQLVQLLVAGGLLFVLAVLPGLLIATFRSAGFASRGNLFGICWMAVLAASSVFEKSLMYVDNRNFLVATVLPLAFLLISAKDEAPVTAGKNASAPADGHPDGELATVNGELATADYSGPNRHADYSGEGRPAQRDPAELTSGRI